MNYRTLSGKWKPVNQKGVFYLFLENNVFIIDKKHEMVYQQWKPEENENGDVVAVSFKNFDVERKFTVHMPTAFWCKISSPKRTIVLQRVSFLVAEKS